MFEALTGRLQTVFRTLRGHGHLTEAELKDGLRALRLALLEADVHVDVVKTIIESVRTQATEQEIFKSLTPGQQIIKLVRDRMLATLEQGTEARLREGQSPSVILMTGLQGSGKTTTTGKLALWLKGKGRSPLLVAADVQRPAAVDQLQTLGKKVEVPVITAPPGGSALDAAQAGVREARLTGRSPVLVDTAGRLHIDDELMQELLALKERTKPAEILYVADAMTGQDAVRSAAAFHARLGVTGAILTKADGDARGGAALSLKHVTGVPIKFVGMGEHLPDLEAFDPSRLVSRLLGMGDMLGLIEKAEAVVTAEEAAETARKLRRSELTFDDLADQIDRMKRMGSLKQVIGMLPGAAALGAGDVDEGALKRARAIISSMTAEERGAPQILDGRRRLRIARGSGTSVADVNRLVKQFKTMKRMMKTLANQGARRPNLRNLMGSGRPFPR
ncbi:MAG TPA: signal recognition particle protein [Candidatus Polarisedimenticolia bacterium]|nr:signal recognition particle protein [Candidatus Polarisedimenticolia bacterium]